MASKTKRRARLRCHNCRARLTRDGLRMHDFEPYCPTCHEIAVKDAACGKRLQALLGRDSRNGERFKLMTHIDSTLFQVRDREDKPTGKLSLAEWLGYLGRIREEHCRAYVAEQDAISEERERVLAEAIPTEDMLTQRRIRGELLHGKP